MKKLAMLLGCGLMAFAIGCSDGGSKPSGNSGPTGGVSEADYKKQMEAGAIGDAVGEKKDDAAGEKKDDAAGEKKEDAAAEKKEEAPAEKKEEAGEKKE